MKIRHEAPHGCGAAGALFSGRVASSFRLDEQAERGSPARWREAKVVGAEPFMDDHSGGLQVPTPAMAGGRRKAGGRTHHAGRSGHQLEARRALDRFARPGIACRSIWKPTGSTANEDALARMTFISEHHRLVFIHVHKTAGTSIKQALAAATGQQLNRFGDVPLQGHAKARELLAIAPELAQYRWLAVSRCPWDRLVSYFHWLRDEAPPVDQERANRIAHFRRYPDFGAFVRDLYASFEDPQRHSESMQVKPATGAVNYPPQVSWLPNAGQATISLIRFDELHRLHALVAEWGIDRPPLPHLHRATGRSTTGHYYDAETSAMVGRMYAADAALGPFKSPAICFSGGHPAPS